MTAISGGPEVQREFTRPRRRRQIPPAAFVSIETLHAWQAQRVAAWSRVLMIGVGIGLVAVLGRVVQFKIAPNERLAPSAGSPFSSAVDLARRGDLLDREGRVIATSEVGHRLFVDPVVAASRGDIATLAAELAPILGADPAKIDEPIQRGLNKRYVVVQRSVDDAQREAIRQAALPGVGLEPRLERTMHHPDLAVSLVGFVDIDHKGIAGVEKRFHEQLAPSHGRIRFLHDRAGHPLWVEPADYAPGKDGRPVRLSIDLQIQRFVQDAVEAQVLKLNAAGGRGIIVDCTSGEILAVHDFVNANTGRSPAFAKDDRDKHPSLGRIRCVTDQYEPGSTFKPFVWAALSETRRVGLEELFPTPTGAEAGWRVPGHRRVIHDSHYYGPLTWRMVLVKSVNTGMVMGALRMPHAELRDWVTKFGFGEQSGCGIPGDAPGTVKSAKEWTWVTHTSVAFGHEIAVTPMQMVRAFCTFARDGTMPQLRITALESSQRPMQYARRVISPETALLTRQILRDVMIEGTGKSANSELYEMFGKSGTADLVDASGRLHKDRYTASFIAGAPLDEPRIVVLVVIDDPDRRRGHFGGAVAGPVAKDLTEKTLAYMGVEARVVGAE